MLTCNAVSQAGSGLQWTGDTVSNAMPAKAQIGFFNVQFKKGEPGASQHDDSTASPSHTRRGSIMTGFTKIDRGKRPAASGRAEDAKNSDVIGMLEKKRHSLARQAAHDQKSFSKR